MSTQPITPDEQQLIDELLTEEVDRVLRDPKSTMAEIRAVLKYKNGPDDYTTLAKAYIPVRSAKARVPEEGEDVWIVCDPQGPNFVADNVRRWNRATRPSTNTRQLKQLWSLSSCKARKARKAVVCTSCNSTSNTTGSCG